MKVVIAVDGAKGPNPDFNKKKPASKDNPRTRDVPKGTEIEGPDAWRLCLAIHPGTTDWLAEPVDDEAKAIVTVKREAEAAAQEAADAAEVAAVTGDATKKVAARKARGADVTP